MAQTIQIGTFLIKEGALLPESLRFESEPSSKGWNLVKNLDGYGLDRKIREAGWTFFYTAGEVNATGFGFDRQKALSRAVKRVIASLEWKQFNCLEITQATAHRFLGLTCVTVSAYSRHIRQAPWAKDFAEWDRAKLAVASMGA